MYWTSYPIVTGLTKMWAPVNQCAFVYRIVGSTWILSLLSMWSGSWKVCIDVFHNIFSLGNWRALHHYAACSLVNIHTIWHFCPPVSMVKDAIEPVIANYLRGNLQIKNMHDCWDTRMQYKSGFCSYTDSKQVTEEENKTTTNCWRSQHTTDSWTHVDEMRGRGWLEWTRNNGWLHATFPTTSVMSPHLTI